MSGLGMNAWGMPAKGDRGGGHEQTANMPSVIIVNWNTRDLLDACLQSMSMKVGTAPMDIVVVDNGSTDGSVDLVQSRYPHVRLVANECNRGFAAANNQAIQDTSGRYVLLLNSDTVVLGDVLRRSVEYMDNQPDVGAMGCRVLNPDGTLQRTCFMFPSLVNLTLLTLGVENLRWPRFVGRRKMLDWDRDTERDVDVVTGCYLLVRRDVIDQVGMLDESFFFYGEEADWCRRMRNAGWKVRFAPVGEIIHHGGASARLLNAQRDVMLTQALVRLHRKHGGVIPAAVAWSILLCFNASRAVGWTLLGAMKRTERAIERGRHFRTVLRAFLDTWPKAQAAK